LDGDFLLLAIGGPPLVKELQRSVNIDYDLATVLADSLLDNMVLVILRLLVRTVEQVLHPAETKYQSTSGSRGRRPGAVTASGIPEVLVKHLKEFSYCQRT
jgi:hypothetical protein